MYTAVCPGNCFMRFIAGAAVGEHFRSYYQRRETSWGKATGGSTRCCTFKGQIAHIYATVACHRPEERLFTAEAAAALRLSVFTRTRQEKKALGNNKKRFFFPPHYGFVCFVFQHRLKGRFGLVLKYRRYKTIAGCQRRGALTQAMPFFDCWFSVGPLKGFGFTAAAVFSCQYSQD